MSAQVEHTFSELLLGTGTARRVAVRRWTSRFLSVISIIAPIIGLVGVINLTVNFLNGSEANSTSGQPIWFLIWAWALYAFVATPFVLTAWSLWPTMRRRRTTQLAGAWVFLGLLALVSIFLPTTTAANLTLPEGSNTLAYVLGAGFQILLLLCDIWILLPARHHIEKHDH
jgi:hypothetical protein